MPVLLPPTKTNCYHLVCIENMLRALIKQAFNRNCSTLNSPCDLQSFRRIRLLRKKYPPFQRYVKDTKCMFGKLFVSNNQKDEANLDLKDQPNTEFLYMRNATVYPCRRLIRKENLQPEVPAKWIKFRHTMYNAPRILLRKHRNAQSSQTKAMKKRKDNKLQHKDLISETIPLTTVVKTHLPLESQVPQIIHNPIILDEDVIRKDMSKTSSSRTYETVTDDMALQCLPSVTTILNEKKSEWERYVYTRILEDVQGTREEHTVTVKEFKQCGIDMESYLKQRLCAKGSHILEASTLILKSLRRQFKKIKDVKALQMQVVHPTLHYKGCVDCVATYKDSLSVIEWLRTDQKVKKTPTLYEASVRLSAYIGAINSSKNFPLQIKKGVIIVASTGGQAASVCELNEHKLRKYWCIWQQQLQGFNIMFRK